MNLTFEQITAVTEHGKELKGRMKPGQKVRDVWKQSQVEKLLRSTPS